MADKPPGRGLIVAGTILTIIGLAIVVFRTFHIPEYWMPLLVGVALLIVGAVRRAGGG
jgi:hypothetical protein